jgi:hypothetical protein
MVTRRALRVLVRAADVAEQRADIPLQWQLVENQLHVPWIISTLFQQRHQWCTKWVQRALFSHLAFSVELATSFLAASVRIDEVVTTFPELNEINSSIVDDMKHVVNGYARRAYDAWMDVQRSYPEAYAAVQTRHAAQILLLFEQRALESLASTGILDEDEHKKLDGLVDEKIYRLERSMVSGVMHQSDDVFSSLPFLQHLPIERRRFLLMHATKRLIRHGEVHPSLFHLTHTFDLTYDG